MKAIFFIMAACISFLTGCGDKVSYEIQASSDVSVLSDVSLESVSDSGEPAGSRTDDDSGQICVYVCGEVASPGVYSLPQGSRVYEAIDAAGGLLDGVDETAINMAQLLADGQQVTVTLKGTQSAASGGSADASSLVNINTATKDELMTLSGIGEARAEAIIDYRESCGCFTATDELMNISGIGEKMYEKIKDDITV